MKFALNSGALAESIAAATSSLATNPHTPILGGVLVEAQIGAVTFSSFNWERSTTRVVAADISDTDTVVVAGRLLAVVGGNLPKNTEAVVTVSDSEMMVDAGRTGFRLPLMHAPDYPALPAVDAADVIGSVDCGTFAETVRVIGGFAATDPKPANLTGLHIVCEPGFMELRATDRYVIARRRIEWSGTAAATIFVPAADLLATIKAVTHTGADPVEILWNDNLLGLRTPSTTVTTRVMAEEFPDIDRVMHADAYHCAVTVPTAELASMLKRAAAVADDKLSQVDIATEGDTLTVTTTQSAAGNIADSVAAVHHGPDRRVALSSRMLAKALECVDDEAVTLAFQEGGHKVSIYPGVIEAGATLRPPDTDTAAVLMGIAGGR
ncbi:DNA polymerase III subunit beta [Mycobacterium ostraviense]|uniref:DNA polymerase III subunit beta n=1 Tax=Mycobacterium ostraviense TaxID=2738409 RepID=A0A164B385_9MYCO|nr:DNA polymerase III subunit beta [Mycobacterium ostraviense]KZS63068.1 hypothetical protein A4G28_04340 [Mycobacterium ostraviense]